MELNRKDSGEELTQEDLQGFTFGMPEGAEITEEKSYLNEQLKWGKIGNAVMVAIPIVGLVVVNIPGIIDYENPVYQYIVNGMLIFMLFAFPALLSIIIRKYKKRISMLDNGQAKCIRIEILEKLPTEITPGRSDNSVTYYYPVLGKDTTSGYEGKVYIREKQYENRKEHDMVCVVCYDV